MPGIINFEFRGLAEMEAVLKELGPRLATKVADEALKKGMKPIVDEAKRIVRKRTGEMRKAIVTEKDKYSKQGERTIRLGFKKPTSRRAHLLEFGTAHSRAFPFVRPAMDSKSKDALDAMAEVMAKGLEREAKALAGL